MHYYLSEVQTPCISSVNFFFFFGQHPINPRKVTKLRFPNMESGGRAP